jgi:ABC-type methionine transport system ATPase subunit
VKKGAGKSSLLDCISLRNQKFQGQVFVNGQPAGSNFFGLTGMLS